jgi:predicted RNase H-like HicB family nuclease
MGSYSFTVVIEPDGAQFHVYVPALPGCHSFGDNQDEALANIREAIELHVESMLEDGEEVPREPEPARVGRVTVSVVR